MAALGAPFPKKLIIDFLELISAIFRSSFHVEAKMAGAGRFDASDAGGKQLAMFFMLIYGWSRQLVLVRKKMVFCSEKKRQER